MRKIAVVIIVFVLSGCAANQTKVDSSVPVRATDVRLILMPLDVQVSHLTAGGLLEPSVEWTNAARSGVHDALVRRLEQRGIEVIEPQGVWDELELDDPIMQSVKLHAAVGAAMLLHNSQPMLKLPSLDDGFRYEIGDQTKVMKERFGADYALFVNTRQSFATGGRVAVTLLAAALVGAILPAGGHAGFASLVDLNTGQVVWFGRTASGNAGVDLREPEGAEEAVQMLLKGFPL